MKTTELFVEQVLIGLAVVVTGALFVSVEAATFIFKADLGALAVLGAVAYLVGILFDRFGDTILACLEQHHRLQFALKQLGKGGGKRGDPFPEDTYRISVFHNDQASDYAHYLRSRIRLTRALTVLAPALSLGIALYLTNAKCPERPVAGLLAVVVYSCLFLKRLDHGLPHTSKLAKKKIRDWYKRRAGELHPLARFVLRNEPIAALAVAILALGGAVIVLLGEAPRVQNKLAVAGAVFAVGTVLTALAGWAWWRITETFFTFLAIYGREVEKEIDRPSGKCS